MLVGRRHIWDKRTQKRFLPQRLVGPRSNLIGCHNIPPSYYLYTTGCQYFKRTKQDCSPTKEPSHLAPNKWPLHEKKLLVHLNEMKEPEVNFPENPLKLLFLSVQMLFMCN
jgi:hypothetical protein